MKILVVDDEEMKRRSLADDLAAWGHQVQVAADGRQALAALGGALFDLVIADLKMPEMDGMELLREIKAGPNAGCDVVIITAYGSIPVAVEAIKRGAFDFITKPFPNDRILPILRRVEHQREEARRLAGPDLRESSGLLVGSSPAMRRVQELIEVCARTERNVLVCGETGCGKDLIASLIHKRSARHAFPFVKVSCAVFPHELFASELYGHEKGAFTGADRTRLGRFDLASGGTLYLDDVDDIPLQEQVKLLRVIEDRVFERVGGGTTIAANVRVIASSKKDLEQLIRDGAFREDLYYRLNVMRIDVPPLASRLDDIPELARHLLQRLAGNEAASVDPEVVGVLSAHHWPGNVRELRNLLERVYLTGQGTITADQVVEQIGGCTHRPGTEAGFRQRVGRFERELVLDALKATGGNKTAAARVLGMRPSTFRDRLEKLGI